MAGGGALNNLFPGYKDKIWLKLPHHLRIRLIKSWNQEFEKNISKAKIKNNKIKNLNYYLLDKFKPNENYKNRHTDYKRQMCRGTLEEGCDFFLPNKRSQDRLKNHLQPYTEEESEERKKHKYLNLKYYILFCLGFSVLHNSMQSRPVAWCMDYEPPHTPHYPFWFKSMFHSHDIPSVRRGFEVYRQICATCHSMEQLQFRSLVNEVYPENRMKQIAASYDIEDGPDDKGEMFTRPGTLTDSFPKPYPNEEAARYANNGASPPDLSVITTARHDGPDYIFSLLTCYRDPPEGIHLRPGLYYNTYFAGGSISMPPPLQDDMIEYEDGTPCNVSQMAKDVVNFLTWAAEPTHDERKLTGLKLVSGAFVAMVLMTVWQRFFWTIYATRRIDFGKIKYL
ncbi:cytochrome c1 precursor, putative [Plasmodium vivax]|uniref:Cytochrome c1, putative n=6 Tax=Plasmodium vivax TaxID=5855 RepID=A5K3C9_PLAVS|nr:cytochrome c1 precursor, putative [Plasmodium vivax]KMZ78728.1 cytochrome c1 [Plasmodium vivax India VII]KMZ85117.1 cytochrome c1 [Plasmodium vivax Brazil I]KMZ91576.1 cytochrome c1 [Plasmodium vivax Mauritania I]KMZ98094.1 cytochrome c1 [Plasmodium vivax North Korean]EDL46033.1 cytochrome c1 precursor, putative [Plasmodium vivax]|eukprot:XP_001615760.1 cytochrome c1 precursor [Plasmodium vivax Sal-1]